MIKYLFILLLTQNVRADIGGSLSDSIGSLVIFPLLFILMYFLLIRPQTKKIKEHKNLIDNIKINDEVFTQGGFIGKIKRLSDQFVILSLNDNVDIVIKKESIAGLLPKGTIKQIK
ncbi:MAG TPA: preprotein translocase subunit YajC [Candidatus Azoamicus sp. OHIO2]